MKVIHLAAFEGNSGDNVSHAGFHAAFRECIDPTAEFHEVELRLFYRNAGKRSFDEAFAREINQYDMFVIGGGLFFDARWSYSSTGTTLDFSREFMDAIHIPVLFNGVGYYEGCDTAQPNDEYQKIFACFRQFLDYPFNRENWLLAVRNDGSYERIAARYGTEYARRFLVVPDNAFYYLPLVEPIHFEISRPTVGFSIANDTFTADQNSNIDLENLNSSVAGFAKTLIEEGNRILLFIHIPADIKVVQSLYTLLGDAAFRFNVVVTPYNSSGTAAADMLLRYYNACDYVVAMRFHSNVIPLSNNICTMGLVMENIINSDRQAKLYSGLGLQDFLFRSDSKDKNLQEEMYRKFAWVRENKTKFHATMNGVLTQVQLDKQSYMQKIKMLAPGLDRTAP